MDLRKKFRALRVKNPCKLHHYLAYYKYLKNSENATYFDSCIHYN